MKIKCNREHLAGAFQIAATVANARSPREILQNVKLIAGQDGAATLMATDGELGVRISLQGVDVVQPGAVLLPVARAGSILRENHDADLMISVSGTHTQIESDTVEFKLASPNPDEFPSVPEFNCDAYHEMPAKLFRDMVRRTSFATDETATRYALAGVLLELTDDTAIAVATDGRRLAKMQGSAMSVGGHSTDRYQTVLPVKSLALMARSIGDDDDELVSIAIGPSQALLSTGRCVVYSRLIEGRYPGWRQVFPKRNRSVQFDMPAGVLLNAVRQAAIVADVETRGLDFRFTNGSLILAAKTAELGASRVQCPIDYSADQIELKLDHRYVTDFLRVLDPESTIRVDIASSTEAAVLSTEDGYSYVLMPMALER